MLCMYAYVWLYVSYLNIYGSCSLPFLHQYTFCLAPRSSSSDGTGEWLGSRKRLNIFDRKHGHDSNRRRSIKARATRISSCAPPPKEDSPKRILFADDNKINQKVLRTLSKQSFVLPSNLRYSFKIWILFFIYCICTWHHCRKMKKCPFISACSSNKPMGLYKRRHFLY